MSADKIEGRENAIDDSRTFYDKSYVERIIKEHKELSELLLASQEREKVLREALRIARNRLNGVQLALSVHGQNIDVPFWIETYKKAAKDADKTLEME